MHLPTRCWQQTESIEVAKETLLPEVEHEVEKIEEERTAPVINGIKLAVHPVSGTISSRYGQRWNRSHNGIDVAAPTGTGIYASAGGTVTYSAYNSGGYGYLVKLSHGNGVETYYGHCSQLLVSAGQTVSQGQLIAKVGNTGRSTGPHLHFEVRVSGTPQNPLNYVY